MKRTSLERRGIMKAIIFDLDGTLFQTEKVAVPAFQETFRHLQTTGKFQGDIPDEEKIQSVFGMTHQELWEVLLPGADSALKEKADRFMLQKELELFRQGKGEIFPGVRETLMQFYEDGWPLFVASNGAGDYVRTALETKGLISLFKGIYTAGEYQTADKSDLVRILKNDYGVTDGLMVGDRSSDIKAGKENQLFSVGCRYTGYPCFGQENELDEADAIIHSFPELKQVVEATKK
ncbi:HAD family hydrolase [Thermoactinomyces vulgaris]|jgi:phosphoglycolate phosphatase|nr:HAD family hydrolase [Thermoactinomyces vulgaris]QCV54238.1 HAD family hydrolase [Thermoactinomyces vulgaris]